MRHALPLVVALLVCLSGCSGLVGPDPSGAATSTPAPVPTDGPAADVPGLSEHGITDPEALATANERAFDNRSLTVVGDMTVTAANGTALVDSSSTTRITANHSRALTRVSGDDLLPGLNASVDNLTQWSNETHMLVRVGGPETTTYFVVQSVSPEGYTNGPGFYYRNRSGESVSVAENGSIRLRVDGIRLPGNSIGIGGVRIDLSDTTVTVWLTERGLLERVRVEHTGRLATDPSVAVEAVRNTRYIDVGSTTVERPDWLPAARNASTDWPPDAR